jgi:excisionase family DNA binding protein
MLTLAEAAQQCGVAKSTINRAIRRGTLSAHRREDGSYVLDPAEVARVYPLRAPDAPERTATQSLSVTQSVQGADDARTAALEAELRGVREVLAEVRAALADARAGRDQAQEQLRLALVALPGPRRGWWRMWQRSSS